MVHARWVLLQSRMSTKTDQSRLVWRHPWLVMLNFGGELVYPEAESTSAAVISAIPDAWGFIVIEMVQAILNGFEDVSFSQIFFKTLKISCQ